MTKHPRCTFFLASLAALAAGFLAALGPGNISACLRGLQPINFGWRTAQFFFNYQDLGFIKRGLIGSLLHPFPFLLTRPGLLDVSAAFLVVVAVAFALLFGACTRAAAPRTRFILGALAVLTPSLFLRLGFDYGRFDGPNLALALAALALIESGAWAGAGLACSVAVLTHEGFIVLHFPLILAYALRSQSGRSLARLALPPLFTTGLVFAFGSYRPGLAPLLDYFDRNGAYLRLDGAVNADAIATSTRSLAENFRYNWENFGQKAAWLHLPIILAWFSCFTALYAEFHRRNALRRDALFYAAFSPLLLGIIALDYYRWFALATVNMLVVMLLRARELGQANRPVEVGLGWSTKIILASCLLGPISNTRSFPFFFQVLDRILPWHIPW